MANISYRAQVFLISGEPDLYRNAPVRSFSVAGGNAKGIDLNETNDTRLLYELEQAKARKNLTLIKTPSEDDLDAVLSGLFQSKAKFGLNFDVQVSYTGKSWVQIVHFFGENASISNQPVRIGAGKKLSLKVEFSFAQADFKHSDNRNGKWALEDEDWLR